MPFRFLCAVLIFMLAIPPALAAKTLRFSGYDFTIKQGRGRGPGPNDWKPEQAFVDKKGRLHLRFSEINGKWYAGEVASVSRFGFGTYEIEFEGDIARLDRNVVFGFFTYPTPDVGTDGTHEIDVEFARWGKQSNRPLNFTVWPVDPGLKPKSQTFSFPKNPAASRHTFRWTADGIEYVSAALNGNGKATIIRSWTFAPKDAERRISRSPMPIFFNLWGFQGKKPSDRRDVEVIIRSFSFTPAE